jgi:hypothetical protein
VKKSISIISEGYIVRMEMRYAYKIFVGYTWRKLTWLKFRSQDGISWGFTWFPSVTFEIWISSKLRITILEIIAVCYDNNIKHSNTFCGKDAESFLY